MINGIPKIGPNISHSQKTARSAGRETPDLVSTPIQNRVDFWNYKNMVLLQNSAHSLEKIVEWKVPHQLRRNALRYLKRGNVETIIGVERGN